MPFRHPRNLKMSDVPRWQIFADLHRDIALNDLAVVQVHLHLEVGGANLFNDAVRLVLSV